MIGRVMDVLEWVLTALLLWMLWLGSGVMLAWLERYKAKRSGRVYQSGILPRRK